MQAKFDCDVTQFWPRRALLGILAAMAAIWMAPGTCRSQERAEPSDDARKEMSSVDQHVRQFLQTYRIPGAAVALTDRGRAALTRGYGYADLTTQDQVLPQSLFRIASLSKPITAVAILQLIEKGKLKIDDKIVDVLKLEPWIEVSKEKFDSRWRDVTIGYLLEHRGGWDRDKSMDAMFQSVRFAEQQRVSPPAAATAIIRAMLLEKLDFAPGERYAYSNFGYCLLGRAIEQKTGLSYEQAVKTSVLASLGIEDMRLGKTRLAGRAAGEVRYYHPGKARSVFASDQGELVPVPYGAWNLEAMDAHGGWLASAEDLAKFAIAFDSPERCPILSAASIERMHRRPNGLAGYTEDGKPKDVYYSLGWQNRTLTGGRVNHWHTGSLDGTAAILIRRADGRNLIGLLNTRTSPVKKDLIGELDAMLHRAADSVERWPQGE